MPHEYWAKCRSMLRKLSALLTLPVCGGQAGFSWVRVDDDQHGGGGDVLLQCRGLADERPVSARRAVCPVHRRRGLIRTPADGVVRGFSGSEDADRLKGHESGRRTMAHVADHLSVSALEQQYR